MEIVKLVTNYKAIFVDHPSIHKRQSIGSTQSIIDLITFIHLHLMRNIIHYQKIINNSPSLFPPW